MPAFFCEEKFAIILISLPLYGTSLLSLTAFKIFLLVARFEQTDYDVSSCSFLLFSCV